MRSIDYIHASIGLDECLRDGFIGAYKDVFAGPPYFEKYDPDEVRKEVLTPHLHNGVVVLAVNDGSVVGFGCAMPISVSPDEVKEFLGPKWGTPALPCEAMNTWYMSELGVCNGFRMQGIAYALVRERMLKVLALGGTHYVMRTAARASNSIHLYNRIGSTEIAVQDVSACDQVTVNMSQSKHRVYLYGSCDGALRKLSCVR